jgi:hypothetical protein
VSYAVRAGRHRQVVNGSDLIVGDAIHPHNETGLAAAFVDQDLDGMAVIDPCGAVQCRCGYAGDDAGSVRGEPGTYRPVVQ